MWKQKIGISMSSNYDIPMDEVIKLLKKIGFDAVSPDFTSRETLREIVKSAKDTQITVQSLHAPFKQAANLWNNDPNLLENAKKDILNSLDACIEFNIPVLVVHVWKGFDYTFDVKSLNFTALDEIISYAQANNIKIAFENTEGEEYLFAVMDHYSNHANVDFCKDSGHKMCYNHSQDLLAKFGEKLTITHLNDNLGISRFDGETYWTDDLHLLPYDGIADWDYNITRLKKSNQLSILNFELSMNSKPNRHENDVYTNMTLENYFTEAYKRACKIAYKYSK